MKWIANKKEAAQFFGIQVQSFDGWITAGCPVLERDSHGRIQSIDLSAVYKWRKQRDAESDGSFSAERTRLTKAQAEKAELENALARGDLIQAQHVLLFFSSIVSVAQQRLSGLPAKLRQRNPGAPLRLLADAEDLVTEALNDLASAKPPPSLARAMAPGDEPVETQAAQEPVQVG